MEVGWWFSIYWRLLKEMGGWKILANLSDKCEFSSVALLQPQATSCRDPISFWLFVGHGGWFRIWIGYWSFSIFWPFLTELLWWFSIRRLLTEIGGCVETDRLGWCNKLTAPMSYVHSFLYGYYTIILRNIISKHTIFLIYFNKNTLSYNIYRKATYHI